MQGLVARSGGVDEKEKGTGNLHEQSHQRPGFATGKTDHHATDKNRDPPLQERETSHEREGSTKMDFGAGIDQKPLHEYDPEVLASPHACCSRLCLLGRNAQTDTR